MFDCPPNYGIFARGPNVKGLRITGHSPVVGEYPEEAIDSDLEF